MLLHTQMCPKPKALSAQLRNLRFIPPLPLTQDPKFSVSSDIQQWERRRFFPGPWIFACLKSISAVGQHHPRWLLPHQGTRGSTGDSAKGKGQLLDGNTVQPWSWTLSIYLSAFYLALGVIISQEEGNFIWAVENLNSETQSRGNYHNSAFFLGGVGGETLGRPQGRSTQIISVFINIEIEYRITILYSILLNIE